jgi:hypothetical protein
MSETHDIPVELYRFVVTSLDPVNPNERQALSSLCLTSKNWQCEATAILYSKIMLQRVRQHVDFFTTVIHHPEPAVLVQEYTHSLPDLTNLSFFKRDMLKPGASRTAGKSQLSGSMCLRLSTIADAGPAIQIHHQRQIFFRLFPQALQSMVNLKLLSIEDYDFTSAVRDILFQAPFNLTELRWALNHTSEQDDLVSHLSSYYLILLGLSVPWNSFFRHETYPD